ncbi:MAG: type II toxin-antitoxin system Phd/YefM family antitoxin [Lachnospiraceae bacterium]|nr:type II toxin-antitoxin system Phd/YefM family antitoxin [Lachnospiraceae bacterium]
MAVTRQMDIRANIKKYFDLAFSGEPVIVSRKENKNVVVISEREYFDLQKAKRNAEYLTMLDRSFEQLANGEVVTKSMDELEHLADE